MKPAVSVTVVMSRAGPVVVMVVSMAERASKPSSRSSRYRAITCMA